MRAAHGGRGLVSYLIRRTKGNVPSENYQK
jgi:hypothetical protein